MSDEHNTKIPKGAPGCTEEVDTGDIKMLASSYTKLHSSESSELSEPVIPKTETKSLASNCADQEDLDKQLFSAIVYKPDYEGTWGGLELIESLIKKGANVNAKDEQGNPLIIAALDISDMLARRDVIQSFLKHGADPNSTSPRRGEDILCLAIKSKPSSSQKKMDKIYIDILKLLIDHGARLFPTVDDTKSKNPVKIVLQYGNVLAFQLFLKYGLTLDRCKDWFPLHCAAKNNDSKVLEFLLIQKRFDIDQIDSDGYTPLHAAVEFNKIECVKILLAYKAEVNCINDVIYVSPLGIALELQDIDCMRLLISYGADVNLFRDDARIPLVVAVCNDFQECAELLLANNAKLVFDELHSMNIYEIALATDNPKMLEILDAYKFLLASQEVNNQPGDPHLIDAALVGQDEELNSIRHMTEIALMQTSIIYGTTPFYEILTHKKICASYVENESVIRALESETLKDKFPIYSQSLINRFAEAKNHADLLKRATDKLSKILGFDALLYYLVARRILAHFDEKDLHGLTLI